MEITPGTSKGYFLDIYGLCGYSGIIEHKEFKANTLDEVVEVAYKFVKEGRENNND